MEKDTYTKEVNAVFLTTFVIGFPYMMFLFKPSLPEDLCISRDSLDILTCAGGGAFCILFCFLILCILLLCISHFAFCILATKKGNVHFLTLGILYGDRISW